MSSILTRTFAADHVTPVRAYAALRAQSAGRSSFLFETALPGEHSGRYSIIGYRARSEHGYPPGSHALAMLADDAAALENAESVAARFSQSIVGFIAYDAGHAVHSIKPWPNEDMRARVMCDSTVAVFDHVLQTVTIAGRSKGAIERCAWEMTHGPELDALPAPDPLALPESVDPNMNDDVFAAKVIRAKGYIGDEDCSKILLARSFIVPRKDADLFDVYRAMRVLSPSPYLCFLDFAETPFAEGVQIASASLEPLVRVSGRKMSVRPIVGVRKRGSSDAEDEAIAQELLADSKARAEMAMLVELARNDVASVSVAESVRVAKDMHVEKYGQVMYAASEVEGELAEGSTSLDALRAAFPAGVATGSPKARAMQVIRQLEPGTRGIFGGGLGYIGPDGTVEFSIAMRAVLARASEFEVAAGADIVGGDSEGEAQQTRDRASLVLAAIRSAHDAVVRREEREALKRKKQEEEERKKAEAQQVVEASPQAENVETTAKE